MALKKTPTRRQPDIGQAPPPTTSVIGPLAVTAQGGLLQSDDRVMFVVQVHDQKGKPVTGLTTTHFRLWQCGQIYYPIDDAFVVPFDEVEGLEGVYHLVTPGWSLAVTGTVPFVIRVERNAASWGRALAFVVKVE